MSEYGTYETTRQNAQPAELYHFFTGNASNAGTSASSGSGGTEVVETAVTDCSGANAPTSTLVETWTGGDDTDIGTRALSGGTGTWVKFRAGDGNINILTGVAVSAVNSATIKPYYVSGHGLTDNQSVTVTGKWTVGGASSFSALVRHITTGATTVGYELRAGRDAIQQTLSLYRHTVAAGQTLLQAFVFPFVTLSSLHTIRLEAIGTKIYGYLDDDLILTTTDAEISSGSPGLSMMETSSGGLQHVSVTRWEAGIAVAPGLAVVTQSAHGTDEFDGANDPDINARDFDGGGQTCLADGTWVKTQVRDSYGAITSNDLWFTSGTDPNTNPGDPWIHYVATGLGSIGNDYSVHSTWTLVAQPDGADTSSTWSSLIARHSTTEESGYEFTSTVVPNASGIGGVGGMTFAIWSITAGTYTLLLSVDESGSSGTGEIALGQHSTRFHVEGNRLCGYYDDQLVITVTDSTALYPTGGYPGICLLDSKSTGTGGNLIVNSWGVYADSTLQPCSGGAEVSSEPLITMNYTSADVDIVYEGDTYTPFIAHRTAFKSGQGERTAAEIDLSLPFDHPVSVLAMSAINRGPIGVIVYRLDRQDTTDGAAAIPLQGQITRHRIEGRWCVITLGNIGTLLTRKLPRILTQRTCPHVLGGPFCRADLTSKTHTGLNVSQVSGRKVTVDGAAALAGTDNSYFQEGVLRTDDGLSVYIEGFNAIVSGDVLTMLREVEGLDIGDTVTLVAGCDHKAATCDTRWLNIGHFGGEPGMPDRNPFTGGGLA